MITEVIFRMTLKTLGQVRLDSRCVSMVGQDFSYIQGFQSPRVQQPLSPAVFSLVQENTKRIDKHGGLPETRCTSMLGPGFSSYGCQKGKCENAPTSLR